LDHSKDKAARALLQIHMTTDIVIQVSHLTTAKSMWDYLLQHFNRDCASNELSLLRQLFKCEKSPAEDLSGFFARVQKLSLQLHLIGNKPSDTILAGVIMNGLPEEYSSLVQTISNTIPVDHHGRQILDVAAIQSKLLIEEQRVLEQRESSSFAVKREATKKQVCSYCGKFYHSFDKCHKRLGIGKYANKPPQVYSASLFDPGKTSNTPWCIDSGATDHMCSDKNLFKNFTPVHNQYVSYGNDSKGSIAGVGDVQVCDTLLTKVLCVPDLRKDLISISSLAQVGYSVSFSDKSCLIYSPSGELALTGTLQNDLYEISKSRYLCHLTERQLWHSRMGHCSKKNLISSMTAAAVPLPTGKSDFCEVCALANAKAKSFGKRIDTKRTQTLHTVHSDVCGPISPPTSEGYKYFVTFTDDATRFCHVYFMRRKDEVETCFKMYHKSVERSTGFKIQELYSDNGGEYKSNSLQNYCSSNGIKQSFTTPHSPQLNGVAESMNRILWSKARAALLESKIPHRFWHHAISWALTTRNMTHHSKLIASPYQLWVSRKPNLRHLRVFGSDCYVKQVNATSKMEPRATKMIFVGYNEDFTGYVVMDARGTTSVRRNVSINEGIFTASSLLDAANNSNDLGIFPEDISNDENLGTILELTSEIPSEPDNNIVAPPIIGDPEDGSSELELEINLSNSSESDPEENHQTSIDETLNEETPIAELYPGRRERPVEGYYYNLVHGNHHCSLASAPTTYAEALREDDSNGNCTWSNAMKKEMASMKENDVWDLVELPSDRKAVGCKWVFRMKDGGIAKGRIVAQGYNQIEGFDFNETFAPVVRFETLRIYLALSHSERYHIHQMDVSTAFLNGDIEETIYMKQPPGFIDPLQPDAVCMLKKSLYGLKQSPRQWNRKLITFLLDSNFRQCDYDPCLFISLGPTKVYVAVYVDDILISSSSEEEIARTKALFSSTFKMTDLGELEVFLGIKVTRSGSILQLSQEAYTCNILEKFGMKDCHPQPSPCDPSAVITEANNVPLPDNIPYRQAVGCLIYLATSTRPDLCFAVNQASRHLSSPTMFDWIQVKRIFRYLAGTKSFGVSFDSNTPFRLTAYADADWGGDIDSRRSTTGFTLMLSGGCISWKSQLQKTVALSSMEAEYMSASQASQEIIWTRNILADLGYEQKEPTLLYEDNQSCIALTKESRYHKRAKHIDLKYHFIRQTILKQQIALKYCPSAEQKADILTKPLSRVKHQEGVKLLNLITGTQLQGE
jgi:transposase InsO family protein